MAIQSVENRIIEQSIFFKKAFRSNSVENKVEKQKKSENKYKIYHLEVGLMNPFSLIRFLLSIKLCSSTHYCRII